MEIFHYEFMRNALISGAILGPMCGFLGVFITLRGLSFFSDAIAHSALAGIALGLLWQEVTRTSIPLMLVVFFFSLALALVMAYFCQRTTLRPDTIIAFSFTGSVALGVIIVSKLEKYRLLEGMLFGDIYANTLTDIALQAALAVVVVSFLLWKMKAYLLLIVQPELARVQGLRVEALNYIFAAMIAATVTVCLKMLGALLLSGLIVIPPAAAKLLARNFKEMLLYSVGIGGGAAVAGVMASYYLDSPTGPTIVVVNILVLLTAFIISKSGGSAKAF
jgi:zinc transport system permease protein